ncbi:uncharacterized protein LOC114349957 [Ostrinia furnacalis]|uniref:uncharacterized protein LOC114349957 n=1 Tax=Ostrinia furnacalis TaxID=93504 RepID=UPI00103B1CCC|nr:uncharacterized protein LOC114349957 [Ostrinia furnacalis]
MGMGVNLGMGVGVAGAGAGAGLPPHAARWRALYARRQLRPIADQAQQPENIYESVNGAGAGGGGSSYWWWRVQGAGAPRCRHARASQTLEFNERAVRAPLEDFQGTMPRAHRGRGADEAGAAAAGAGRGARLSASCGTIHVELPPCVLLLPRWRPAPAPTAPPAPRPSCSYHLLPESHRVLPFVCHQSTSRECCSDSESDDGAPSDSESEMAQRAAEPAPSAPSADASDDD